MGAVKTPDNAGPWGAKPPPGPPIPGPPLGRPITPPSAASGEWGPAPSPPPGGLGQWGPPQGWEQPQPKAGNARTGPLPLHPMTVGDILDGAFKLFRANLGTLAVVIAVLVVPFQLLAAFFTRNLLGGGNFLRVFSQVGKVHSASLGSGSLFGGTATLVVTAVNSVVLVLVAGAISRVVASSYLGERLPPGPAIRTVLGRLWALLVAWFLAHVLMITGFVLFILPGLLLMALFVPLVPAIVVEGLGPLAGMRRSWRLAKRRIWAVMGIALLVGLMASVLGFSIGLIPQAAGLLVGSHYGWILTGIGRALADLIVLPITGIAATLIYFDLRIRSEGFDLAMVAADLADRGARP